MALALDSGAPALISSGVENQGLQRMPPSLFREEVSTSQSAGWLGPTLLSQPISIWVLAGFAIASAVALSLFLCLAHYTRRQQVEGVLVPSSGLVRVSSPATGILERVDAAEGQRVRQGQVLARVSVPRVTPESGDTATALDARLSERSAGLGDTRRAQAQQLAAQETGVRRQRETVRRQLEQIEGETRLRAQQTAIARESLERLRALQADRYVGDLQVKQQESQLLDQELQTRQLERQAVELRRRIAEYEQTLAELPARRALESASFRRDLAGLEQERIETRSRGTLTLVASVSGMIGAQLLKAGQAVEQGQTVAAIVPGDGRLEAEILIPSHAIGFVSPGDRVLLRYRAFPYQKFGHHVGTISRVSRSALNAEAFDGGALKPSDDAPYYRATVVLERQSIRAYGQEQSLMPGMLFDADILGERRRLIEWLFEPIYSLGDRVGAPRGAG